MPESNIPTNNPPEAIVEPEPDPLSGDQVSVDVLFNHDLPLCEETIQRVVRTILGDYRWRSGEVSVAVVDDETIHRLNRQFLQHDYETDVLTFDLDSDERTGRIVGEIVISGDTAITVAGEQTSVTPVDEAMLYVIHGALHLAGLDDKNESARVAMRAAEAHYTRLLGIGYSPPDEPDPLTAERT